MSKPIVIFVFSQQCGACINFKRKALPELEKELKDRRIDYEVVEYETMNIQNRPVSGNPHPDIKYGYIRFFPTILLVPSDIWRNHKTKLRTVVKHGDEENPKVDYSKAGILSWIEDTARIILCLRDRIMEKTVNRQQMEDISFRLSDSFVLFVAVN